MNLTLILIATAALGIVGGFAAAVLAGASRVFRVREDPRIAELMEVLPGANCGGCGYPGCSGFAAALVAGEVDPSACAPGGSETARRVGEILGVEVSAADRMVARLLCRGGDAECRRRLDYQGLDSCKAVTLLAHDGTKACRFACEGLGDCVEACPFGAMEMGPDHLPVIDEDKCTGCGLCVTACPKDVLRLERDTDPIYIACRTDLTPKAVREACSVGCLGCQRCVRACPFGLLTWEGRLPSLDSEQCRNCGLCVDACRQGGLVYAGGAAPDPEARAEAEKLAAERAAAKKAAAEKAAAEKAAARSAGPDSAPTKS